MHELMPVLPARMLDHSFAGFRRDALPLVSRQDKPTRFVDRPIPPGPFPISDTAQGFRRGTQDDLEDMVRFRKLQITQMTPPDLFGTFWSAKVRHHVRVAQ